MAPVVEDDGAQLGSSETCYGSHVAAEAKSRHLLTGAIPQTDEESVRVLTDVYGRSPPLEARRQERMAQLDREIHRIPPKERGALDQVRFSNPVVFEASSHARLLVESEPFDPADAALRLARYWERRVAMFGDRAFSDNVFAQPVYSDYLAYYHKCIRVLNDPQMEDDAKSMATIFVNSVQRIKIESLDRVLEDAPAADKKALVEAQSRGAGMSKEHKLMFLQREEFMETEAAQRMMKYWDMKLRLFGPDKFCLDVSLHDIEICLQEKRFVRLMPGTDHHQRTIMAIFANALEDDGWTVENVGQYYWCIVHAALERQSCRDNGLVVMLNYKAGSKDLNEKIGPVRHLCRSILFECLPVHLRATHVFFGPSAWWQWLLASIFASVGSMIQKRAVIHLGTDKENRLELEERFGISPENVPEELGGDYLFDSWDKWLKERGQDSAFKPIQ